MYQILLQHSGMRSERGRPAREQKERTSAIVSALRRRKAMAAVADELNLSEATVSRSARESSLKCSITIMSARPGTLAKQTWRLVELYSLQNVSIFTTADIAPDMLRQYCGNAKVVAC